MKPDWEAMLDELLACEEEGVLTPWEVEFADSLDKQRRSGGERWQPTAKQEAILESILSKI